MCENSATPHCHVSCERQKPDDHPVSQAYWHALVHAVQNLYAFLKKRRRVISAPAFELHGWRDKRNAGLV